ncbi:MAG: GNAT family N-acetyltransferase [Bacteroidota bacterium]
MENIFFRRADKNDIAVIQQLANKIWYAHYTSIVTIEQIDYMLEKMYSLKSLEEQMKSRHEFFLAFVNDIPAGFISVQKKEEGIYFLPKFYVDTSLHRKGIGTKLFEFVLHQTSHPKEIELTVNRNNSNAINFYLKLGFIIDHPADFDIGNGFFMNDYVMKRISK